MTTIGPEVDASRPVRRNLQLRLAAIFGAMFCVLGLLALAVPYVLGRTSSTAETVTTGGGVDGSVRHSIVASQHGVDAHRQLVFSALALVLLAVFSLILGWFLAGRTLRPLRTINATAREISASNLHRRLDITGPYDELAELGATLDDLLARLEASFASQHNFVSNASHELRTPLTAERTLLQVALSDPAPSVGALRSVCEELLELGDQQVRLIDDLLLLAQSEGGIERPERFDLSVVARSAVQARTDAAAARSITIETNCGPAPLVGDRRLVGILVGNLVDNAIRHNQDGGYVRVRTSHSGRGSTVAVSNSGRVLDESDVEQLCEPFTRLASTRRLAAEGTGLGLAIVRAVSVAHRGDLQLRARQDGGLAVEVTFLS